MLRSLRDPTQLRLHEKVVQFPFSAPTTEEKTEEEGEAPGDRRDLMKRCSQDGLGAWAELSLRQTPVARER